MSENPKRGAAELRDTERKRAPKSKPSRPVQVRRNFKAARTAFSRLAYINFPQGSGAMWLSLDYKIFADQIGRYPTLDESREYYQQYVRLLRRLYKENGAELVYMYVRHRGRRAGRIQYHMLISKPPTASVGMRDMWESIAELWEVGFCHLRQLHYINGRIDGLINIFFPEYIDLTWHGSNNLKREKNDTRERE